MRNLQQISLACICLWLAGCVATGSLPEPDIYARNVLFTVPGSDSIPPMATSFSSDSSINAPAHTIIQAVLKFHGLRKISQFSIHALNVEAVVAEIGAKRKLNEVIRALGADQRVMSVQSVKAYKLMTYNDPYFALQNTMNGDRIDRIHEISTGKNVIVGIVDTGVDRQHPELSGSIIYTRNFVAHDLESFDQDEHGTAVAGVIGSAANNDLGIVGVAPDVKLMVFKACHQDITSRRTSCDSVSIIKALSDVLVQNPDILNLSLSGPRDVIIEKLLKAAYQSGMVLVGAVDESRLQGMSFPANLNEVIAVGTSINLGSDFADMVLAPGTDMLTTAPGATYGFKSGSSIATAYVSGIVALMKERMPSLTSAQIYRYLRESARNNENQLPVVDMCAAVKHAANSHDHNCERIPVMAVRVDGQQNARNIY